MKKIELLSPAGNMDSLKAAISAGCDAVYLAGTFFGARSYAGNFTNIELKEAIDYAHLYGVKVYITVNTIIYEHEIESFLNYIDYLVSIFVDALIIQDLGMMDLIRKIYPSLELHASTQMNIHNKEGVKLLESLGIKRVVLARETSLETIKEIKKDTNIQLEVFGHGALCMSYSGGCYMSYLIGGRSGNRGTCAQCCRQPYDLIESGCKKNKNQYLLSTKDLCVLENIKDFIDSGIDSLKIEGRMKRPEYVFLVTKIYREAIDAYYENEKYDYKKATLELQKLFSRNFTKGFLMNEENNLFTSSKRPNHKGTYLGKIINYQNNKIDILLKDNLSINDGIRIINRYGDVGFTVTNMFYDNKRINDAFANQIITIPLKEKVLVNDEIYKTTDSKQIDEIRKNMLIPKKINIKGKVSLKIGQPMILDILYDDIHIIEKSEILVQKAVKNSLNKKDIIEKINQLGNTVYSFNELNVDIDDNIFFPLKEIKEIRRKCINKLTDCRLKRNPVEKREYKIELPDFPQQKNYNLLLSTGKQKIDNRINYIYVENELYDKINDSRKIKRLPRIMNHFPKESLVLVGELGSLYVYKDVFTDFSLNVTNSYAIAFLHSIGVKQVTLSYELKPVNIKQIIDAYHKRYNKHPNVEVIVEGKLEAMITKYDLYDDYKLSGNAYLRDKYKNLFEIQKKNNYNIIYHFERRNDCTNYFELGVNSVRIEEMRFLK